MKKHYSIFLSIAILGVSHCTTTHDSKEKKYITTTKPFHAITLVEPIAYQPISYFDNQCSRCHGDSLSRMGGEWAESLGEIDLVDVIDEMSEGPGEWPLEKTEFDAQVAFHRSLIASEPFIILNKIEDSNLFGEVMQGSELSLSHETKEITASVNGTTWSATLPESLETRHLTSPLILKASLNGVTTQLDLTKHAYSHHKPLPQ